MLCRQEPNSLALVRPRDAARRKGVPIMDARLAGAVQAPSRLSYSRVAARVLRFLRLAARRGRRLDKSLEALAAVGNDELDGLSETGQRLRREARRSLHARSGRSLNVVPSARGRLPPG
jgi:hypothetical protein